MDLCFDMIVLSDSLFSLGPENSIRLQGRQLAWLYYHAMLNSKPVNFVLLICIVTFLLGTCTGISRSGSHNWRRWAGMALVSCVGNSTYIFVIFPRYILIRLQPAYDESFFEGWGLVFQARMITFVSMAVGLAIMASLLRDDARLNESVCPNGNGLKHD